MRPLKTVLITILTISVLTLILVGALLVRECRESEIQLPLANNTGQWQTFDLEKSMPLLANEVYAIEISSDGNCTEWIRVWDGCEHVDGYRQKCISWEASPTPKSVTYPSWDWEK